MKGMVPLSLYNKKPNVKEAEVSARQELGQLLIYNGKKHLKSEDLLSEWAIFKRASSMIMKSKSLNKAPDLQAVLQEMTRLHGFAQ